MSRHLLFSLFALMLSAQSVAGPVFTCKDENGKTTFSDQPCPKDQQENIREKSTSPKQQSTQQTSKSRSGYGNFIDRAREIKPTAPKADEH